MLWRLLLTVFLLASVLVGCRGPGERVKVGAPAPDFTLPTLDGSTVVLSQLRGKRVIVAFTATWCTSCQLEYPIYEQVYQERSQWDAEVLVVSISEDPATVADYAKQKGLTFPFLLDKGEVARKYRIANTPTAVFIDSQGIVRYVKPGAFGSKEELVFELSALK